VAVALLSRCHDEIDPGPRRPQITAEQHQWAELAHRTREPASLLRRLSPSYRQEWLAQLRWPRPSRPRARGSGGGHSEMRDLVSWIDGLKILSYRRARSICQWPVGDWVVRQHRRAVIGRSGPC
jgi:hypothetical protein